MNPRERMLAALRGGPVDRVPLEPDGLECTGPDDLASFEDPLARRLAERVIDVSHFRVRHPSHINRYLVTPPQCIRSERHERDDGSAVISGVIETPKGDLTFRKEWDPSARTWWNVDYPVETVEDVEKIASVPWQRPAELRPPEENDLSGDFAERGLMTTYISSPFVCAAGMMPYETFLEWCATRLDMLRELTDICLDRVLDCLEVLLSGSLIEYVWMGGSEWVTPPMAAPDIYDALVQEQERAIIDYVHDNSDAIVHVHCHGRVRDALPKMIERGVDYTEPVEPPPSGDITMAEAKAVADGRITLGGNIECALLCNGTPERVEEAVCAAFEGGKGRFVLRPTERPSPEPSEREFRNYTRMIDVWEELSPVTC
ncbi:MAG: uroporphyrinogen decarboxylase family protein [Candidatus Brocadiia bacterium]